MVIIGIDVRKRKEVVCEINNNGNLELKFITFSLWFKYWVYHCKVPCTLDGSWPSLCFPVCNYWPWKVYRGHNTVKTEETIDINERRGKYITAYCHLGNGIMAFKRSWIKEIVSMFNHPSVSKNPREVRNDCVNIRLKDIPIISFVKNFHSLTRE